ncbi:MAG: multiheme c-type cytochrome [Isosphaeraceae bacterium]
MKGNRGFGMKRTAWSRRTWTLMTGAASVGLIALGLMASGTAWRLVPSSSRASWPVSGYSNTRPGVKYVGDAACASCHEEITASYHRHPMGRSMALGAESPVPGLEDRDGRVGFESHGLSYTVERRDGRVVHAELKKDAQGAVLARNEWEVAYAIGSGRRGRSYLVERDGFLAQSPMSWYTQQMRWDLSPDSPSQSNHFQRPIDPSCLFCHANRFEPVPETVNAYRPPTFRGLSIGCERCHGPGELHLKDPGLKSGGLDPTIVNPARLEPALRESVCNQCHLGGRSRIERESRTALDYRPGLPLSEFLVVLVDRTLGATKAIGHVEQMRSSGCYRASGGRLGCTSCHDPHALPAAPERVAYYRGRCLECHGSGAGCSLPKPARREKSREDSCIDCHMPRSPLANVAHTAETDHSIPRRGDAERSPLVPSRPAMRDEPPLVAIDAATKDSKPGVEFDRELGIALAGFGVDAASDRARLSRFALPRLEAALKENPDDLVALQGKIIALTLRGRPGEAITAAEAALTLAPNHERTLALAVPLLAGSGRRDEAIALSQRLQAINPHVLDYKVMLAKLLAQAARWGEAAEVCRAALKLNPLDLTVRHILIKSALETGDRAAAKAEAETYLRFDLDEGERNLIRQWLESSR